MLILPPQCKHSTLCLFVTNLWGDMASTSPYLPLLIENCEIEDAITEYFCLGFSYNEIRLFLATYHNVHVSSRTLTRKLRSLGLRRHSQPRDWNYVLTAVEEELSGSGSELGYRTMQARLRHSYQIQLSRETVRLILRNLDPRGVMARQRLPKLNPMVSFLGQREGFHQN